MVKISNFNVRGILGGILEILENHNFSANYFCLINGYWDLVLDILPLRDILTWSTLFDSRGLNWKVMILLGK